MQRYGSDLHSFNYGTNIYESIYFVLGVGTTGVSGHGFCPHVTFSLGRKELEEEAGKAGNHLVYLFGWQNIFVLSFSSFYCHSL